MLSEKQVVSSLPLVVDVSGRGITEVAQIPGAGRNVAALTADNNRLASLKGLHNFASLVQLSLSSNSLVDMSAVSSLSRLVTLNLQSNSITDIAGLDTLPQLEWLGLAGNTIKAIEGLSCNTKLNHLDLSDNCLTELGDLSKLHKLKTLLLHGNAIASLKSVPDCFPPSLTTLSLAENHVQDLNEMSFLSTLPDLTEVSVMGNLCVSLTVPAMLFDYRPYIVYWCPRLSTLDGIIVSAEEKLRSVSLFQSDRPYPFTLGQHQSLVHYLMTLCPLTLLQDQLLEQSVTSDPSSHTLLSQAMSLQNPQQKAEVMQKLRVLQVLEQMISQQEDLLHTQQASQVQDASSIQSETLNSSLADTTLTETATADVLTEEGERAEEMERAGLQPSLPFGIAQKRSTGFVTEVSIGRQAVRIAWADPDTQKLSNDDDGVGGGREDDGVESAVADEAGREGGRRGEEAEEEEVERGEEGGRERGRGQKDGRLEETSFDRGETLNSVSSSHSSLLHSLPSSVGNLTDYSEMSPPTTSAASIAAAARNGLSGMGVPATYTVTSTTNAAVEGLEGVTAGGMNPTLSEVSREKFDSTSHLHTAVEDQSQSSLPVVRPTALHAASSTSISVVEETSELSLSAAGAPEVVKGVGSDANLQTYSTSNITRRPQGPLVQTTSAPGLTGFLSAGESREGFPLGIKYSLPVDPVLFHTQEREGLGSFQPLSLYTDVLESDSLYLPVLGNGNEASPAREWNLSALASSLSQAYGIADSSERSNLLATLVGSKSLENNESEMKRDRKNPEHETESEANSVSRGQQDGVKQQESVADSGREKRRVEVMGGGSGRGGKGDGQVGEKEAEVGEAAKSVGKRLANSETKPIARTQSVPQNPPTKPPPFSNSALSFQRAVLTLQAGVRGYLCRKRVRAYLTQKNAATIIQATWKGYRSRKCDPVVVSVRRELSHKKMEAYVTTTYLQLKGCREELAHQAQVVQLQEETIASLIQEVESLHVWRGEVEGEKRRRAAVTIQRYWRGSSARQVHGRGLPRKRTAVEYLWALSSELRAQLKDLQGKVNVLQVNEHRQDMEATETLTSEPARSISNPLPAQSHVHLPSPSKLTMCKHSPDTILLQWEAPSVCTGDSLLGYRVYINGILEGMVGPAKTRAYIDGLDTSEAYRISLRALYTLGESEDSNMLLVASVTTHREGSEEERLGCSLEREMSSLAQLLQPPHPAEQPILVGKTSALSTSASCSAPEIVAVPNFVPLPTRSSSTDQVGLLVDQKSSFIDQTTSPISVDQAITVVGQTATFFDQPAQISSPTALPSVCVSASPDNELETTLCVQSGLDLEQEAKYDISTKPAEGFTHPAAASPVPHCDATSSGTAEPCLVSTKPGLSGGELPPQIHANLDSFFTGEDTEPLSSDLHSSTHNDQSSLQTQPPLMNETEKPDKGYKEPHVGGGSHLSSFPITNAGVSRWAKTKSANSEMKVPTLSVNPKSTRLAAKFDAHMKADFHGLKSTTSPSTGPQTDQSLKHDHYATGLPTSTQLAKPQSALNPEVCPTQSPLNNEAAFAGQANQEGPSEVGLEQINFSGDGGFRSKCLGSENRITSQGSGQGQSQRIHARMLGCDSRLPTSASGSRPSVSSYQQHEPQAIQTLHGLDKGLDKSRTPNPPLPASSAAARESSAVSLPVNSNTLASTLLSQLEADLSS